MTNKNRKVFNVGFIGGSIKSAVGRVHQIATQMDGRWHLAAGCFSRDPEINRQTAESWGVSTERTYQTMQELFRAEKSTLDAILILTPTPVHLASVAQALEAGFSVICEKALATSSEEAAELMAIAKKKGRLLAVTYNYSGYPMLRELKALIRQGQLGKVHSVHAEMPQEGFLRTDKDGNIGQPQQWRLQDKNVPTISLDLGVHLHHLIEFLTGSKPCSVIADSASNGLFKSVLDDVNCLVKYTGGMRGQIWYSKSALGHRNGLRIRIYGEKASAEWLQVNPEELELNHQDGRREILDRAMSLSEASSERYCRFKAGHPAGFIEAFANLYSDIADKLMMIEQNANIDNDQTKGFVYGAAHAMEGLKFFEAAHRSVASGHWENIEGTE